MLTVEDVEAQPDLNFIDPHAYSHAQARAAWVRENSGTLNEDRLLRNLLSSMPLAFNVFGALGEHPELAWLLRQTFAPQLAQVNKVLCEWSPRPKSAYLGDNTAFDAAIWFVDNEGQRCLLGVEVKYTDDFSRDVYDRPEYRALTESCGWFRSGASDRLVTRPANQMWRNLLLAASLERDGTADWTGCAVLSLADDAGVAAARQLIGEELKAPDRLRIVSLEGLVAKASEHPGFAGWAGRMTERYLGPTVSIESEQPAGPAPRRVLRPPDRSSDFEGTVGAHGLSWHVAAHLLTHCSAITKVDETHPGGGLYDCLRLSGEADERTGFSHVLLNRVGSATVWDVGGHGSWWWQWGGIWAEIADGMSPLLASRILAHHAQLEFKDQAGSGPPAAHAARAIGDALLANPHLSCEQGVLDTSSEGAGIREAHFRAAGLTPPTDWNEARRLWFLGTDEAVVAIDLERGTASTSGGSKLDLHGTRGAAALRAAVVGAGTDEASTDTATGRRSDDPAV